MIRRGEPEASIASNSYAALTPGLESVGVRTHQLRADSLDTAAFPRIAEEFLLASRVHPWDVEFSLSVRDYFGDPMIETYGKLDRDSWPEGEVVDLPPSAPARLALDQAIRSRRTRRYFTGDPVGLPELATLIRAGGAVTGLAQVPKSDGETVEYQFRAVPSGGGLYPIEIVCAAARVARLGRGVYRYSSRRDQLVTVGRATGVDNLLGAFAGDPEFQAGLGTVAAVVCLVATPWRSMRKYGPRGMRFVFHEAGAIAQNLHLVAAALGVGTMDCSSYFDTEVDQALGCDGEFRTVVHTILVGSPS
jgi:SagB-type dehydrogenase family enzyme